MGKRPQQIRLTDPDRGRKGIFVTSAEIFNWAAAKTAHTQEGERYHDAMDYFNEACKAIASFFDGSRGTFINPMTGQTISYPTVCDQNDVADYIEDYFNTNLIYWPLFSRVEYYTDDNDEQWYSVLKHWSTRIQRFCKFNNTKYDKLIKLSVIDYNPLADYWSNEKEIGANSPYVSISNNKEGQVGPAEDMTVDDWNQDTVHSDGYITETTSQADNDVTNKHYTTTYDDASMSRLESYDVQTGGTKNTTTSGSPNSGYFRKKHVEGNDARPVQDIIEKEFDIANLWNIFELFMDDLKREVYLQVWWIP